MKTADELSKIKRLEYAELWKSKNKEKIKSYKAKWRQKNREKIKKKHSEYYKNNIIKERLRSAEYRANNKDDIKRRMALFYVRDRDKLRERGRRWEKENPEKCSKKRSIRRALKNGAIVGNLRAIDEWEKKWRKSSRLKCYWCKELTNGRKAHLDHILSLSRGGSHSIDNLCVSCASCNLRKHSKPIDVWNRQIANPILL